MVEGDEGDVRDEGGIVAVILVWDGVEEEAAVGEASRRCRRRQGRGDVEDEARALARPGRR